MNVLIIVLSIIALIVIVFVVLFILAKMKGRVEISLDKYEYSPGDTIKGKIILKLKKPLHAKSLQVGLVGQRTDIKYTTNAKGRPSKSRKTYTIFNFFKPISKEKDYPSGESIQDFELKIPENVLSNIKLGKGIIGSIAKSIQILSKETTTITWQVIANLDVPGINISNSVKVNIV